MSKPIEKDQAEYHHVFGEDTLKRIVRSGRDDDRDWIAECLVSETLAQFQIHHLGETIANKPYCMIRNAQDAAFFLSTDEGAGEVMINGEWVSCGVGQAAILPPNRLNAFRACNDQPWKFHYVKYYQEQGQTPFIRCKEPVIAEFSATSFGYMMNGLLAEIYAENRANYVWQWLQLIKLSITDYCEPWMVDDRLWQLWDDVGKNLSYTWSLDEMAQKAFLSAEHLRRLTRQVYGRSPMKQLRWLRMQRAAEFLISTDDKVEVIGMECGYKNVNTFTRIFKEFFRSTPSEYRGNLR